MHPALSPAHRPAHWIWRPPPTGAVAALRQELGLGAAVAQVLVRRGYGDPAAAQAFLHPSLDQLHDGQLLLGLPRAVARLHRAISQREKILLYGDYDVDGTMSIVLLTKAIELAGGSSEFHVPHRLREGYGMRPEIITEAAARGVSLIVSVDTGIRAGAVVEHARSLAIDVIVTDHHLPEEQVPAAVAVVNPNQPGCPYPNKHLCGAGVAFKLAEGLLQASTLAPERQRKVLDSLLKLAAMATVADVVPLRGENRVLVHYGLLGLERTPNPGLRALLDVAGIPPGKAPTARQVGFQIGPRINAAGRMADAREVVELLLHATPEHAARIATQLDELNSERQQTEAGMVATILEQCVQTPVTDQQPALVFWGEGWHKGVVGIVASRIVERFHRPVFVLGEDPATGLATGSGRSVALFHLLDALESMPELFTKFGGHKQAAGVTLERARLPEFRQRLEAFAARVLSPEDFRPQLELDGLVTAPEVGAALVAQIAALAPFGNENDPPLFGLMDAQVVGTPRVVKEQHVFFDVEQGGRRLKVKAWRKAEQLPSFTGRVDLAVTLEEDRYDGWSATLREIRPALPL
ncbi:MAG: single-stranded-DNA-specific exonuclease RecJ [Bryobacteraceae bacterium]|nr:single-stranded-DNA-specific exonuclease RecJ [Bryobacteraceae bacterium]